MAACVNGIASSKNQSMSRQNGTEAGRKLYSQGITGQRLSGRRKRLQMDSNMPGVKTAGGGIVTRTKHMEGREHWGWEIDQQEICLHTQVTTAEDVQRLCKYAVDLW